MLQAVTFSSFAARLVRVLVRRVFSNCVTCRLAEPDQDTELEPREEKAENQAPEPEPEPKPEKKSSPVVVEPIPRERELIHA